MYYYINIITVIIIDLGIRRMKQLNTYVMYVDGNMMKKKDIQKEESLQEQNGKMFQKILNVHYVL